MKVLLIALVVCVGPALAQRPGTSPAAPPVAVRAGAAFPGRVVIPPAGAPLAQAGRRPATVPLFLPAPVAAVAAGGGGSLLGLGGAAAAAAGIAAASLLSGSTTSTTSTR